MSDSEIPRSTTQTSKVPTRRRFLGAAASGVAGAAAMTAPMIAVAQSPVVMKMQGAWGAKDIWNEMAEDYVTRVNEMSGGRLKIDYLVAGAVVKPFEVTDAVNRGVLDAGHTVAVYWYGKSKVASLFGSGPVSGIDAAQTLAWIYNGGGLELYQEVLKKINLDLVGYFANPMPTQPLGWFRKEIKSADDMKGLKYRTVGLAADLMQEMGLKVTQLPGGEIVPAMDRGVIEAFEFNNPTSDRRFGAQDVAKNYMMGSYHQSMEFFEIIFNRRKHDALPKDLQAILRYAVEAVSTANYNKAMDNYSKDLDGLINEDKVNVRRTPKSIFDAQLKAWDVVTKKLVAEDPLFKKVLDSQMAWAKRIGRYYYLNNADYQLAYEHVQGKIPGLS